MPVRDDLGTRMKTFYEEVPKTKLMRRTPVAIRIDGRAFHTFTRGFQRPFDRVLMESMQQTMKYLCENIQGCVFGFTQSDEITLILTDYNKLTTSAWFDYEVQKLCSISASMATMIFNKFFAQNVDKWGYDTFPNWYDGDANDLEITNSPEWEVLQSYNRAMHNGAMFDARCFNIPKEEVTNLIYWRQLDATRNSIQMVGQANFSHKELQNKTCNMIQDMLYEQKGINWNDFPTDCKRGAACNYTKYISTSGDPSSGWVIYKNGKPSLGWLIDRDMPILKGSDREYVDKLVYIGE